MYIPRGFAHGYLTLEDDSLMQWCVDNDFCGEAAKAVRYDSDFIWESVSWLEGGSTLSRRKTGMRRNFHSLSPRVYNSGLIKLWKTIGVASNKATDILNKGGVCYENIRTLCTGDRTN